MKQKRKIFLNRFKTHTSPPRQSPSLPLSPSIQLLYPYPRDMLASLLQTEQKNYERLLSLMPLSPESLASLRDYYKIGLTYSSNALEGNSLTESETKVAIEYGLTIDGKPLRDVYEAQGHAKSYDYLYEIIHNNQLSEFDILTLHRLFYQKIDEKNAGKYREIPVFIS
jgi:Fic family protein